MQTGPLNMFWQHDDNDEWLAGWVRNWNWEGLHEIKVLFFAYCAYIWNIFSHIFRSGCPKVRHNHFIKREWVYLEALHPQDFYLVKLLLLLLDPVTMMAQDEDGTATLAGYQRNGETWSVSSCWPPPHTISISINTRQSGARDATCVEPQVSFFSLVYCYYTNYYCLQTLHGHHHTSTPTPGGRKGARDATHLGPQVSFHIWYLTQLLFTVAMRPPPFPSPTFIPPSLIPTPDEWTEAWDPGFFSFFIDNYF